MKKHKNKIIAAAVCAAVLIIAFVWGGNNSAPQKNGIETAPSAQPTSTAAVSESVKEPNESGGSDAQEENKENIEAEEKPLAENQEISQKSEPPKTDKYKTEPVPEGMPAPVEPQETTVSDKKMTCTMSVTCSTILENIDKLNKEKLELIPQDGVIFAEQTVDFYEGESVFNLLRREMKKNKTHMEFVNTPVYNSAYIEGIANIYEFDCGELSGWMYKVNGKFPNYGCSRYQLKQGDRVEWVYTCDLGKDVGEENSFGGQKE